VFPPPQFDHQQGEQPVGVGEAMALPGEEVTHDPPVEDRS
jgi:hypothetical protein